MYVMALVGGGAVEKGVCTFRLASCHDSADTVGFKTVTESGRARAVRLRTTAFSPFCEKASSVS